MKVFVAGATGAIGKQLVPRPAVPLIESPTRCERGGGSSRTASEGAFAQPGVADLPPSEDKPQRGGVGGHRDDHGGTYRHGAVVRGG